MLVRDGTIESVGRMPDLRPVDGDVEELDGRGLCAMPGLVDCHTHPAWGGDRVEEFSLRAAGAGYEELHAAGGGILSTVRATRALDEAALRARVSRHAGWMLRARHDDVGGQVGLRARPRHRARVAPRRAGGRRLSDLARARTRCRPSRRRRRVPRLRSRGGAAGGGALADAADVFLERGAFDAAQARRYLDRVPRGGPRAAAARRPVHGERRDPARGRARRAVGRPSRGDRGGGRHCAGRERRHRRPAAGERALPRPADAAGARARRRGRGDRARDRLQPGQLVHDEPAARLLARAPRS